jgi:membrane-associated phospholipid phosphatase
MSAARARRAAVAVALGWVVVSALVLWAVAEVALGTATGQRWDDAALDTVYAGRDTRLTLLSGLGRVSIGLILAVMVGCMATALMRGRGQWAVAAVVVIAGANVTTQLLKQVVLTRPDVGFGTLNSLPSGHTTVVASATAAALLVVPPALRGVLAVVGAAATTLTGASTIVAGWHRPSDIIAALAVSLLWAAAVSAVVSRRLVRVRGAAAGSLVGAAGGLVVLAALGVRPVLGWDGVADAVAVLGATAVVTWLFTWAATTVGFDDVPRETSDRTWDDDEASSAVGVAGPALSADRPRT